MFQLLIVHQEAKIRTPVKVVASFSDAHNLVDELEERWKDWKSAGFPQTSDPIQFLEGSDIYLVRDDGVEYYLDAESQWQIID